MKIIGDLTIKNGKVSTFRIKLLFNKFYPQAAMDEIAENLVRIHERKPVTDNYGFLGDYLSDIRELYGTITFTNGVKVLRSYHARHNQTAFILSDADQEI